MVSGFTGTLEEKPFGCWNILDSLLMRTTDRYACSVQDPGHLAVPM
jgi:hypothetical protein